MPSLPSPVFRFPPYYGAGVCGLACYRISIITLVPRQQLLSVLRVFSALTPTHRPSLIGWL
jgi:hypothetical protein